MTSAAPIAAESDFEDENMEAIGCKELGVGRIMREAEILCALVVASARADAIARLAPDAHPPYRCVTEFAIWRTVAPGVSPITVIR